MKIAREIPSISVIDVVSSANLDKAIKQHPCDFVISTTPVNTNSLVVNISPLLNDADIQTIENYAKHPELRLMDPVFIFLPHSVEKSQKEIIHSVSERLKKQKLVSDRYEQAIWDRENEVSTFVGNNTAIPHAKFDTVNKSSIVIVTTENMVRWGSNDVNLIMFLSFTKNDAKLITKRLQNVYYMLYNQSFHSKIVNAITPEEMHTYFCEVYHHEYFRNH